MMMTTEMLRVVGDAETDFSKILANPILSGLRLIGELLVAILTPALIDRYARRSSRILK
jgi:hypothetical protein